MAKRTRCNTETVKVRRSEERVGVAKEVITSTEAARAGLPRNCVIIPMRILEQPEPIKRSRK